MTRDPQGSILLRRRGRPWWLWLLALLAGLLVLALLWTLVNNRAGTATGSPSPSASASTSLSASAGQSLNASGAPAASAGGSAVVTDIGQLVGATDVESVAGSRAELTGVKVLSVVSGKVFWVGASPDQRVLVVFEQDETGGPVDPGANVKEGQTVTISGVVRKMPSADEAAQRWGLSEADAASLKSENVFIRAQHAAAQQ